MKPQNIEQIRKQFKHEWLLIAVDEIDKATTTPITGHLLAHNPSRDEIYKLAGEHSGHLMTIYSDDWPEDLAAAFLYVNFPL